jgi:predicted nucleic acid-binding protein
VAHIVLLDTGPLGLLTHPNAATSNAQAAGWLRELVTSGVAVRVPEISDYELRRELLRLGKTRSVAVLDRYKTALGYVPLTTESMLRAAAFWADVRREGKPTAPDLALDGDAILAGQAAALSTGGEDEVLVATTNVGHLSRFVTARLWQEIRP